MLVLNKETKILKAALIEQKKIEIKKILFIQNRSKILFI